MHFQAKRSGIKEPNSCRRLFPGYSRERALAGISPMLFHVTFLGNGGGGGLDGMVCLFQFRPPMGNVTTIVLLFGFEDPLTERESSL